jgi:hypothetical protein
MHTRLTFVLMAFASCAALPAAAAGLDYGARIRWVSAVEPNTIRNGTFVGFRSDTLFVSDDPDSRAYPLQLSALSRLEASQGNTYHAGTFALIGGVSGALAGLAMSSAMDQVGTAAGSLWGGEPQPHSTSSTGYVLTGAGIGAGLGYLIAIARPGPEKWKPVDPGSFRLGLGPGAAGPSLCLSVRF